MQVCTCLAEILIRDIIVRGIDNNNTRKKLLKTRYLKLNDTIDIYISTTITAEHMTAFESQTIKQISTLNQKQIQVPNQKRHTSLSTPITDVNIAKRNKRKSVISDCGKSHPKGRCPAYGATCTVCEGKKSHRKRMPFKKKTTK